MAIRAALGGMAESPLRDGALGLLDALGYRSDRTLLMGDSPEEFLQYFNSGSPPTPTPKELQMLSEKWQGAAMLAQITDTEIRGKNSFVFNKGEIKSFVFIAVDLKKGPHARGDLTRMTRTINKMFAMPAIMIFRDEGRATIAVIHRRPNLRDATRDVLEKVTLIKDISLDDTHAAHTHILAELSLGELIEKYNCGNFDSLYAAWRKTLDISELKNRFYKEVANWFFWAVDSIVFPAGVVGEEARAMWVIRLITRLMFCWFVMEKNLINACLFDEDSLREILSDKLAPESDSFYKAILQNLFFATLNQEMDSSLRKFRNRSAADSGRDSNYMSHNFYRYKDLFADPAAALQLFADAPFLNGGLFECLDRSKKESGDAEIRIDGFSDHKKNPLRAPNNLFFGENQKTNLSQHLGENARDSTVRGLISIFNSYKFTVEESTPLDEEVALDPELLGKVLENLLAAYNPDTKQTARKATGSFYTPREIVDYMATESLSAYFVQSLGGDSPTRREKIQKLLSFQCEGNPFNNGESRKLISAIDRIKILDPAVGSGAFPMGALNKLTLALSKLDPNNALWKERQINRAESIEDPGARKNAMEDIERRFRDNELGYGRKLFLIENCIYGADILPVAVQIAKLRFFISLLVDQRHDDSRENRGVTPLPNLEAKFLAADTLMELRTPRKSFDLMRGEIADKEKQLADCRRRYFSARTSQTKDKYREEDKSLRGEIAAILRNGGFPKGEAGKIAEWNLYDPNISANWFNSELMFGIADGFDIVIGNPPYDVLNEQARIPKQREYAQRMREIYRYAPVGKLNLYRLFMEKGANLVSENGTLIFIVPNTLLADRWASGVRKMLRNEMSLHFVAEFPEKAKVFESVTQATTIFLATARKPSADDFSLSLDLRSRELPPLRHVRANWARIEKISGADIPIPLIKSADEYGILEKMHKDTCRLGGIAVIKQGDINLTTHREFIRNAPTANLLMRGEHVSHYAINLSTANTDRRWIDLALMKEKLGSKKMTSLMQDISSGRIICQNVVNMGLQRRIIAALIPVNILIGHSAQFLIPKSGNGWDVLSMLTLLASTPLNWRFKKTSSNNHVNIYELESLPFPKRLHDNDKAALSALADKMLSARKENPAADISQWGKEVDDIVYRLYAFTAAEIRLIESAYERA